MTNCGACNESCCTSLEVTGGMYYRSSYLDDSADGGMDYQAPATVSSFRLDRYLVTVGRFRQFVTAVFPPDGGAGWLPAPGSGKHTYLNGGNGLNVTSGGYEQGWVATDDGNIAPTNSNLACDVPGPGGNFWTWTDTPDSNENLPINCVNWYEAYAFCVWDGGFLPSEAEWQYAAAGGSQQREYPWGSTDPGMANQYAIYGGCYYPSGIGNGPVPFLCTGLANIAPVGSATLGEGLWGQFDLAGDVYEWNVDWYADYATPCADCANFLPPPNLYRVLRGGSWWQDASQLSAEVRFFSDPTSRATDSGLRCARAP
jgi:formylglycine-generating enzyme required for sulfatase activity